MKIAILTQPLGENYGGLLQAYALQRVLGNMGHQVWTEDNLAEVEKSTEQKNPSHVEEEADITRSYPAKRSIFSRIQKVLSYLCIKKGFYFLVKKVIFRLMGLSKFRLFTNQFIKTHIKTIATQNRANEIFMQYGIEAYIVGSDQVWRPINTVFSYKYFLDFTHQTQVKRVAYAASFGTDEWEFTAEQTTTCASLLKKFDAVSVREKSAVQLCKDLFGVDALQTLDPTFLLTKEDYLSLIKKKSTRKYKKNIITYILDVNIEKCSIMQGVSDELQCKGTMITPHPYMQKKEMRTYENDYYLSVEQWLSHFNQASFVITDSFHGCVFAILFNKPFVVIDNKERGSTRFHSLLDLFNLRSRLVNSVDDFNQKKKELLFTPIDFDGVNSILQIKRRESIEFLKSALAPID